MHLLRKGNVSSQYVQTHQILLDGWPPIQIHQQACLLLQRLSRELVGQQLETGELREGWTVYCLTNGSTAAESGPLGYTSSPAATAMNIWSLPWATQTRKNGDPFLAGPGLVGQVCWRVNVYGAAANNSPKCRRPALHGWCLPWKCVGDSQVRKNSFLIPSHEEWSSLGSGIWGHPTAFSWYFPELQYTEIGHLTAVSIYPNAKNSVCTK